MDRPLVTRHSPLAKSRHSIGAPKRATIDGISTHCGYLEIRYPHGYFESVAAGCDTFMLRQYGQVWQGGCFGHYTKPTLN